MYYSYKQNKYTFFLYLDDFRLILKMILKITIFCGFSLIYWFSEFNILKVIFKLNSLSINKKYHLNIKCSLSNKTLHFVKTEIFSIKLWWKLTKLIPMTITTSGHKNEIRFFRYHLPCPWILKIFRRNKWFNLTDINEMCFPSWKSTN